MSIATIVLVVFFAGIFLALGFAFSLVFFHHRQRKILQQEEREYLDGLVALREEYRNEYPLRTVVHPSDDDMYDANPW